ncbi:pyridine nucleotide-disulfide oxidoreductase-domain-containing protein [Dendryphion nanum]|uniref:Pyridine nucleotide-disulfide oxidoreductase-domain-containing protein n=1 Tax=Dendryphion nanum TaxID=256645 RepID=A0A9P9DA95_9PLEO|nr:pyridine nucleotide-disulfide oxidoreductase-domain-containing protein [Dendryphion nanum]
MQLVRASPCLKQFPLGVRELAARNTTRNASTQSIWPRSASQAPSTSSGLSNALQKRDITIDQLDGGRDKRERVVVLGSGWAGYSLARQLDPSKYQCVVVSPRSYFAFTPLLASTAVGTLEFRTALEPIRTRRTKVDYFQGWADGVDFENKTITIEQSVDDPTTSLALTGDRHAHETKGQREKQKQVEVQKGELFDLKYDKLVISVGCYSQTFGTPGVKEHALFLKDVGDARQIRNRILACFEAAALPTTSDETRKQLLNFAVVGGGPTGIEFSAELHDIITEDLAKIYPELIKFHHITVYDVAEKVLPMFDEKLAKYAMETFRREGISIKTSHHVQELRPGAPGERVGSKNDHHMFTLKVKEEGDIGVGMVVWSTGLMQNPFVAKSLNKVSGVPEGSIELLDLDSNKDIVKPTQWQVKKDSRSGSVFTNERLQMKLETTGGNGKKQEAVMKDIYAIGDCAIMEGSVYPATAQVASQKAVWLAKRLNRGDLEQSKFTWKNMGIMAYVGNWNALLQGGEGGGISGRAAWFIWRGAYLTKSVSLRNKILIPTYWFINWLFGRDISRF